MEVQCRAHVLLTWDSEGYLNNDTDQQAFSFMESGQGAQISFGNALGC